MTSRNLSLREVRLVGNRTNEVGNFSFSGIFSGTKIKCLIKINIKQHVVFKFLCTLSAPNLHFKTKKITNILYLFNQLTLNTYHQF